MIIFQGRIESNLVYLIICITLTMVLVMPLKQLNNTLSGLVNRR